MRADRDDGLERLLAQRGDHLIRAAIALAGSRAEGEELLQAGLERLVRNWRRVSSDPEGYLRRTMCNLAADGCTEGTVKSTASRGLHKLRELVEAPSATRADFAEESQ